MDLKNKKILITGATGGIGNSLVKKFQSLGSKIVATDCIANANTHDAFFVAEGSILRWSGSTAEGEKQADQVGVRFETGSVGVLELGGISGCSRAGISAGNRSHVFETVTNQQSGADSVSGADSSVTTNLGVT